VSRKGGRRAQVDKGRKFKRGSIERRKGRGEIEGGETGL
jgi:hypothetical protein